MVEIGRTLLGDGRQHAEAHQNVALGIEKDHPLFRARERHTERKTGVSAHRRIAERHIEARAARKVRPIPPAPARNDDCVLAIRREDLQHVGCMHHWRRPLTG